LVKNYPVNYTVGILPCKFYCGYFEYPENSAVGILNTLKILLWVF